MRWRSPGETLRAFPISNWTELDVWQYILLEGIPIVPLYFAAPRPVVERDGVWIMVDDDRMRLRDGERPQIRNGLVAGLGRGGLCEGKREGAQRSQAIVSGDSTEPAVESR